MSDEMPRPIILLAFANDRHDPKRKLRNLAEEKRRLRDTLEKVEDDRLCKLVIRENAMLREILDVFENDKYRDRVAIFHYAGHANSYQLLFETAEGRPAPVDAAGLAAFLNLQSGLKVVFLNGCSTQAQAHGLLDAGVPVVIATSQAIDDGVATTFAYVFYEALAKDAKVRTAFKKAGKAALRSAPGLELRHLYAAEAPDADIGGGVPWVIYPPDDAPEAEDWSLSELRKILQGRLPFEPETIHIPAGPFWMGSERGEGVPEYETPRHQVHPPAYWIGKYPVTNEQYAEFVRGSRSVDPPPGWYGLQPPPDKPDHPVAGVSWYDALAYCQWLSDETGRAYTLPSEAQWEKAARGTEGQIFPWGNDWEDGQHCNTSRKETTPVCAYPSGVSPYGCFDMVGNVREWTRTPWGRNPDEPDEKSKYPWTEDSQPDDESAVNPRIRRVHRGRGEPWDEPPLRASMRAAQLPNQRGQPDARLGFRVALLGFKD